MTSYAYRCVDCGADFDRPYKMGTAPETTDCPESSCDGTAIRLVTAPSVHFGEGFSRSSIGARTQK